MTYARSPAPDDDLYSTSWYGPPPSYVWSGLLLCLTDTDKLISSFSAAGNIVTLDVLNAAFSFVPSTTLVIYHLDRTFVYEIEDWPQYRSSDTSAPGSSSSPTEAGSGSSNTTRQSSDTGTIIGGVVGGVVALTVFVAAGVLWKRHKHRRNASGGHGNSDIVETTAVEPFIVPSSDAFSGTRSSKWERFYTTRQDVNSSSPLTTPPSSSALTCARDDGHPHGSRLQQLIVSTTGNDFAHDVGAVSDTIHVSGIPALVNFLNDLWQNRQTEPPPQYEN